MICTKLERINEFGVATNCLKEIGSGFNNDPLDFIRVWSMLLV